MIWVSRLLLDIVFIKLVVQIANAAYFRACGLGRGEDKLFAIKQELQSADPANLKYLCQSVGDSLRDAVDALRGHLDVGQVSNLPPRARRGSPDPAGTPRARRGSPDPAGTPDRRSPCPTRRIHFISLGTDMGDLRSGPAAGSGDPRRALPRRAGAGGLALPGDHA